MGKEPAWNATDADSLPGSGKSSGGRHSSPLQYSHLENSTDGEAWQVKESDITEATEHSTLMGNGGVFVAGYLIFLWGMGRIHKANYFIDADYNIPG